jgi:hypothetical protein
MEPINASSALRELFQTMAQRHLSEGQIPEVESILTVLTQVLTKTVPQETPFSAIRDILERTAQRDTGAPKVETEDPSAKIQKESLKSFMQRHAAQQDETSKTPPTLNEVPPLVSEQSLQEDAIRGSFVLAGLGNSDAYGKFIAAIKLRGSSVNKMSIEGLSTVLDFLHPELTFMARTKLATILSVVL